MDFETKNPGWKASGTEPSTSFKEQGFRPGYRPPAGYFNWFWKNVSDNIAEIKDKLTNYTPELPPGTVVDKATTAEKVENSLIVRMNGGTSEGSSQFTFNGEAAKTVNITPDKIGAMSKTVYDNDGDGVVDDAKNGLWLYKATLSVSAWVSASGAFTQTVNVTPVDGGPPITANTQLGGPMTKPTGVQATDEILQASLNIVNAGTATPGDGNISCKVWENPESDIDIYWYGRV